jgi:hypothetical protein
MRVGVAKINEEKVLRRENAGVKVRKASPR